MVARSRRQVGVAVIAVTFSFPQGTGASPPADEGTRRGFAISAQPLPSEYDREAHDPVLQRSEPIRILMSMSTHPRVRPMTGRIRLGAGLEWMNGDSIRALQPAAGEHREIWTVTLRAVREGPTELRASMSTGSRGDLDEMDIVLPMLIGKEEVRFGHARSIRAETVRGTQRYRYGGTYLVPIDGPEEVTSPDIKQPPSILRSVAATCKACPDSLSRELPFVVFVRANGSIHSTRFLGESEEAREATPDMIQSAESALAHWRFRPARTAHRSVAHWILVRVPIRGTRDDSRQ